MYRIARIVPRRYSTRVRGMILADVVGQRPIVDVARRGRIHRLIEHHRDRIAVCRNRWHEAIVGPAVSKILVTAPSVLVTGASRPEI